MLGRRGPWCLLPETYNWPGNVRELENLIERVLALSHAELITTRNLSVHLLTTRRTHPNLAQLRGPGPGGLSGIHPHPAHGPGP
ncbi:MAG: hypothetical protein QOF89_2188 [Acidobacteriota bacterium]|jgi:DNA-binding NtrC family response regulator|nr:hypothetical protein [Acidobacteriota bacterium]